jgi:phosphoribosylformylglycinamidine synthase
MTYENQLQGATRDIFNPGLVVSSPDCSDGGLSVALAECSFGGIGASIEIEYDIEPELLLFHEGPSRVLVSTMHPEEVKKIALFWGVECPVIGVTIKDRLLIRNASKNLVESAIDTLRHTWDSALTDLLHPEQHPHV